MQETMKLTNGIGLFSLKYLDEALDEVAELAPAINSRRRKKTERNR
jgi:hypothetical protein